MYQQALANFVNIRHEIGRHLLVIYQSIGSEDQENVLLQFADLSRKALNLHRTLMLMALYVQ